MLHLLQERKVQSLKSIEEDRVVCLEFQALDKRDLRQDPGLRS